MENSNNEQNQLECGKSSDFSAAVVSQWSEVEACVSRIFAAKHRTLPENCTPLELVSNAVLRDFLDDDDLLKELNFVRLLAANARHERRITANQSARAMEIVQRLKTCVEHLLEHPEQPRPSRPLTEYQTRKEYIDFYLEEAGWKVQRSQGAILPGKACIEIKVTGMPNASGEGYCDYVLFGHDNRPLAVVEAKKASESPEKGRTQVQLYGKCLAAAYGVQPVLYYTNGYEIWCLDGIYGERRLTAFHTLKELESMIHRRTRKPIEDMKPNRGIANRPYQVMAITSLCEHLCNLHRRGLLVMATGTGKTRTAIALVDVLTRSNWIKNILFLADRTPLVNQAYGAFAKHLDSMNYSVLSDPAHLGDPAKARIMFSTYQTMINYVDDAKKRFSPGRFDLIIVDEAHRSIFNKYGAIFNYFDALLVGLTATPKDDVDRNTYLIFDRENGVPNFDYSYEQAVKDGFLVPYKLLNRTTARLADGIVYNDLSPEEQAEVEDAYDGEPPERIESSELFQQVYNEPTCDKVLQDLMENGLKIHAGELLGKSIIFACNHKHADMIVKRFQILYPNLGTDYCKLIDNYETYAQATLEDFKLKEMPRIAVSVDMLDTGVDVPEVLNLVFFKKVRSKTKFIQMIGRGTRLCDNIFGPGQNKDYFLIFDYCGNFKYFSIHADEDAPKPAMSLSQRLFALRLRLVHALQSADNQLIPGRVHIHDVIKGMLYTVIESLSKHRERIQIRLKQSHIDKFAREDAAAWQSLTDNSVREIETHIVPLLDADSSENYLIKMFDVRMTRIEIPLASKMPVSAAASDVNAVERIAAALLKLGTIPEIKAHAQQLNTLADPAFWEKDDLDLLEVEALHRDLRSLIPNLKDSKAAVKLLHVDDDIRCLENPPGALPDVRTYRRKVTDYLTEHADIPAVTKIKHLEPINCHDLKELEDILWNKLGTKEDYDNEAYKGSLAGFVRSIVGLDSQAIQQTFGEFLNDNVLNSEQQAFVMEIIEYLEENGELEPADLQEAPFNQTSIGLLFQNHQDVLKKVISVILKCQQVEGVAS